jgi:hypothetical protein
VDDRTWLLESFDNEEEGWVVEDEVHTWPVALLDRPAGTGGSAGIMERCERPPQAIYPDLMSFDILD